MMRIFNTLSRKKEILKPRVGKKLNMFVCGPTVYDASHLGHARTYIVFDVVAKYLRTLGFTVSYILNITDIDDKIIQRAKKQKQEPKTLALRFEKAFLKDMKALGINSPDKYARATSYIKEIISQVERLIKRGYAYELKDGIYYDIAKFKDYGKLSGRTIQGAEDAVSRIDESKEKRNKGDFALWKFSKKGEPKWKSPWGDGRPGWHIEDTAITEKEFGAQYDIHGGARDLIFPHHEAEISQMEAISGKTPLAQYWMHPGLLRMEGQKMSKSLGNFITIEEFLSEHSFRLLRYLMLKTHYRSPLLYSERRLKQAGQELERIDEFISKLKNLRSSRTDSSEILQQTKKEFTKAMEDDFNTPLALSTILSLVRKGNSLFFVQKLSKRDAGAILEFFKEIDTFLGFLSSKTPSIPSKIKVLAEAREVHRRQGEFKKADAIRIKLQSLGWVVEDTKQGPKLKQISE